MSNNPYPPPSQFSKQTNPADRQKPTAATVFGILNILFGVLGICGYVFSFLSLETALSEENALVRTYMQVNRVLGFVESVVLTVAGIGLIQLRPYGRTLCICYGIYAIVKLLLVTAIAICVALFPKLTEPDKVPGAEDMGRWGGLPASAFPNELAFAIYTVSVIVVCLGFIYPASLLYFMYRPNVVAAFKK